MLLMPAGNPFINRVSIPGAVVFLFVTTLFIRFPFFFRDFIDRDESTFILMGQSIADGHLPYVHLWDLKPPLLFYIFGLIESFFPHSFVAIRFFGVLIVFASALLLLRLAKQHHLKNGFLIALLYIILSSELGNLQGVMSEHLAVFFLLLGLVFLNKKSNAFYLIAGLFFGCALLCKLSFAYAVAALMACSIVIHWTAYTPLHFLKSNAILVCGILLPFFIIAGPFYAAGKTDIFINAVFRAPLDYANGQGLSLFQKLKQTWWIVIVSLFLVFFTLKYVKDANKPFAYLSIAMLLGTVYTFFSSGIINNHYLIQVYPFILMLVFGILIQRELRLKPTLLILFVLIASAESLLEYYRIVNSYTKNSSVYYRQSFQIRDELKKRRLANAKIFFIEYHIGHWLLGQYPLTKSTTHPSTLARPYLFKYFTASTSSLEELKYLMEQKRPDVVVGKQEHLGFFPGDSEENNYFKAVIKNNFRIIYHDEKNHVIIWQRH
jgi:hypothetical protein